MIKKEIEELGILKEDAFHWNSILYSLDFSCLHYGHAHRLTFNLSIVHHSSSYHRAGEQIHFVTLKYCRLISHEIIVVWSFVVWNPSETISIAILIFCEKLKCYKKSHSTAIFNLLSSHQVSPLKILIPTNENYLQLLQSFNLF